MVNLNPVDNLNIVPNQNFANHVPQFANRNPITPVQFLHNPNAYDYYSYKFNYNTNLDMLNLKFKCLAE